MILIKTKEKQVDYPMIHGNLITGKFVMKIDNIKVDNLKKVSMDVNYYIEEDVEVETMPGEPEQGTEVIQVSRHLHKETYPMKISEVDLSIKTYGIIQTEVEGIAEYIKRHLTAMAIGMATKDGATLTKLKSEWDLENIVITN